MLKLKLDQLTVWQLCEPGIYKVNRLLITGKNQQKKVIIKQNHTYLRTSLLLHLQPWLVDLKVVKTLKNRKQHEFILKGL